MRRTLTLLLALFCACAALPAWAQAAPEALYRSLGERPGIQRLMDDFVQRLKTHGRIGPLFKDTSLKHLSEQLTDQVCELSGGPCKRDGPSMKQAHQDMDIGHAEFNALVEALQDSMDAQGVPFGTQNRLLALLAPLHREIITR